VRAGIHDALSLSIGPTRGAATEARRSHRGEDVHCSRGGKEVHSADVAQAVGILLTADGIAGEVFNCYDRHISELDVATIARELSGSASRIIGEPKRPKHQIATDKLRTLGMDFGGEDLLRQTVAELVAVARAGVQ
jgi:nucleoside-diphosphate-sugar epimerase